MPADQRYSYSFDGSAQVLDHALITENLMSHVDSVQFGRVDADFAETARNDPGVPTRLSDHDPLVVFFNMQTVLPVLSIGDVTVSEQNSGTTAATFTVSLTPASTSAGHGSGRDGRRHGNRRLRLRGAAADHTHFPCR